MGGAFLARADDATAASWNPAGLSYLRKPEITGVLSSSGLSSDQTFVDGSRGVDHRSGAAPEFFAGTYPFEIGSLSASAQLSYERVVSFRNHRTFTNLSGASFDVESAGGFDVVALGTGVRLFRRLRVGLAVNRWIDGYAQNVDKTSPRSQSFQRTDFGISAWNTNLGVIFSPWESLNIGLVGKSPFSAGVDLKQYRADAATLNFSHGQATLDFPAAVGAGLSYRPRSAVTLSVDYTRTYWSDGRIHNFFILPPPISSDHSKPTPAPPERFPSLPYPTLNDSDQKDTQQLRGGSSTSFSANGSRYLSASGCSTTVSISARLPEALRDIGAGRPERASSWVRFL
jgi:hypothetical protein